MNHDARKELISDFESIINRNSVENESGTPDFILAEFLVDQLEGYHRLMNARAQWRGENLDFPIPALVEMMNGQKQLDS